MVSVLLLKRTITAVAIAVLGLAAVVRAATNELAITVDTYVDSRSYDSSDIGSHGTDGSAKAVVNGADSPASFCRALLRLPDTLWTYPTSRIVSAKVYMYAWQDNSGDRNVSLFPLTTNFVEGTGSKDEPTIPADGATWWTADGTNTWKTPGGDFDASRQVVGVKEDYLDPDYGDRFFHWDITSLLKDDPVAASELQQNGVLLRIDETPLPDSGTDLWTPFISSDSIYYAPECLPRVELVTMDPPTIATLYATNVTAATADLVGRLVSAGGAATTVYGYWGTNTTVTARIDFDTFIDKGNNTKNYGASSNAKMVASTTPCRVLFMLPSSLWSYDPATIASATVSFYTFKDNTGAQDFRLYPLTRGFVEGTGDGTAPANGATWDTYDGTNAWTTAGGDYDAGASVLGVKGMIGVYTNGDAGGRFFTWDLTPLLTNATARAELQNYGALLDGGTVASGQKFANCWSSDKTGYPQNYLPMLTVTFKSGAWEHGANLGTFAAGVLTNSVGSLSPGTSYAFTFMASNSVGVTWAVVTNFFTTLGAAPVIANTPATAVTNQSATLNATLVSAGGLPTKVYYRYGTNTDTWAATDMGGAYPEGALAKSVDSLLAGTTYYYQFMASNAAGFAWAPTTNSFTTYYGVSLSRIRIADGVLTIDIDRLTPGTPNVVERSFDLVHGEWAFVTNITGQSVSTNWFEPLHPEWTNVFYRVRRGP